MNKSNNLIPILIDFEGISSFCKNIPYMFSLAYKINENEWTIISKMIPYDKMNSKNWAKAMLFELELAIFNNLNINSWKEFNKKCCFYAWSNEFENSIFRKIFDEEDIIIIAEDMLPDRMQIALDNFKNIEKDSFFVKFKQSFLSKENSIKNLLPNFIGRELREKALQQDGRLASILGFINREVKINPKWGYLKDNDILKTLEDELFKYSISDIKTMILLFNKREIVKQYYHQINNNKFIIATNKQKIGIYDEYIEMLNGLEDYNLLGPTGDLSQMLSLFFAKNNIEESEESNLILKLYKKILAASKLKNIGKNKQKNKFIDYEAMIDECQNLCTKYIEINEQIYDKVRQEIYDNNLKIKIIK